jgi:hypothetical protein
MFGMERGSDMVVVCLTHHMVSMGCNQRGLDGGDLVQLAGLVAMKWLMPRHIE